MSTPQTDATVAPDERLAPVIQDLSSVLVPGETIQAVAVQRRFYALTHRRLVVAATTGRLLAMFRKLLGGYDLVDVRWQDLKDVHLRVGMIGSDLTVHAFPSQDLAVQERSAGGLLFHGLSKLEAEHVYRICQENGQAWREKRRQRELEEMRARAGGVQIGGSATGDLAAAGGAAEDLVTRLQRAQEMRVKGLISDAEFEAIKAKIVGSL